jgi:hypothetical protein
MTTPDDNPLMTTVISDDNPDDKLPDDNPQITTVISDDNPRRQP